MRGEIQYQAGNATEALIASLGRTEDIRFSPSNRRLAIAGFGANRIVVVDIELKTGAAGTTVVLGDAIELEATTLRGPHGLCFLDEETIAVANRDGGVQVFGIPTSPGPPRRAVVTARRTLVGSADARIDTPGSLAARALGDGTLELLVCNNYSHRVTRHLLDGSAGDALADELLLQERLDIPDGIDLSDDGRWLAISNHNTHSVLLYDRSVTLGPRRAPDGVLRNVLCPHGVRFTSDQKHLLVADASAPFVNVYTRGAGSWHGTRDPVRLFRVMADGVFARGRHNPEEGGPKGIDISKDMRVLAVTSEFQILAFFDVAEVVQARESPANRHKRHLQWVVLRTLFKRLGYMPGARALTSRAIQTSL